MQCDHIQASCTCSGLVSCSCRFSRQFIESAEITDLDRYQAVLVSGIRRVPIAKTATLRSVGARRGQTIQLREIKLPDKVCMRGRSEKELKGRGERTVHDMPHCVDHISYVEEREERVCEWCLALTRFIVSSQPQTPCCVNVSSKSCASLRPAVFDASRKKVRVCVPASIRALFLVLSVPNLAHALMRAHSRAACLAVISVSYSLHPCVRRSGRECSLSAGSQCAHSPTRRRALHPQVCAASACDSVCASW